MHRPQQSVKIAAVQAAPVAFDLIESLKKVEQFTAQAASQGAELVVFPEAFLSAYPWRYAFDATIGSREPRGMKTRCRFVGSNPTHACKGGDGTPNTTNPRSQFPPQSSTHSEIPRRTMI
jgi:hypothetical protein